MIIKTIHNPNELISCLDETAEKGFIFRGHSKGKYILQPQAFREQTLRKRSQRLLQPTIISKWMASKSVNKTIDAWTNGIRPYYLSRLFEYIFHLMRYNHEIQELYLNAKSEDKDSNDLRLLNIFSPGYWLEQDTFKKIFAFLYAGLIRLEDLYGNLLKEAFYLEEITGFDESKPQHYGFHTALLDWTDNPLIAIHFATYKVMPKSDHYIAIFAFKQRKNSEIMPIKIVSGAPLKDNIRILRQEGKFTYFTRSMEFFIKNGFFPSMESYNYSEFGIIRFNLEKSQQNLTFLKKYIEKQNVCRKYLFPDERSEISESNSGTIIAASPIF